MLSRSHRVSSRQLSELMVKGKIYHSPLFLMRAYVPAGMEGVHVAAVAPQKIFKTAPARNNMKRKTYEAVREVLKTSSSKDGAAHLVGLFAKATAVKSTVIEITTDLKALFVKAGIVR